MLAWLMSQARRTVLLPGFEEELEVLMLPRYRVHGVRMDSVLALQDQHYSPQDQIDMLVRQIRTWRTRPGGDRDAGLLHARGLQRERQPCCAALSGESAQDCPADRGSCHRSQTPGQRSRERLPGLPAVAGGTQGHPRTGPRRWPACIEVPSRLQVRCGGHAQGELSFALDRYGEDPPVFRLGLAAHSSAVDLARDVPDPFERSMVQLAEQLIPMLLSDGEKESSMILAEGRKEGLSERTIYRAGKSLGVEIHRRGRGREHKSYWTLPGVTPEPLEPAADGVSVAVGGSGSEGESNP